MNMLSLLLCDEDFIIFGGLEVVLQNLIFFSFYPSFFIMKFGDVLTINGLFF